MADPFSPTETLPNEERNRLIVRYFNSAPDWIHIISKEGKLVCYNKSVEVDALRVHGVPISIGLSFEELVYKSYPNLVDIYRSNFNKALSGETAVSEEQMDLLNDGHLVWMRAVYSPLYNENGDIDAVSMAMQSINEEKLAQELVNMQEVKLRLIAHINSHEVRGPLATLLGLVNLISNEENDLDELKNYNKKIKESANKLDLVIRKIVSNT
jgi:PAS domain S-box-containing protein